MKKKKRLSVSGISTIALVAFAIAMLAIPECKVVVLQGLMKLGVFQPHVRHTQPNPATAYNVFEGSFINSNGVAIHDTALKGKILFINFWATWCPPCIAEMPAINQLYQQYRKNPEIVFLLVNADGNLASATTFMKSRQWSVPVCVAQGALPKEWLNETLPTTVVLNKKGQLVFRHEGLANYNSTSFHQLITTLLTENP